MLFHYIIKSIFAIFRRVDDCGAWSKMIYMSQPTHTLMQILILKHKHRAGILYYSYAYLNGLYVQERLMVLRCEWMSSLLEIRHFSVLLNTCFFMNRLGFFWVHSEHCLVFLSFYHLRETIPCTYSSVSSCFLSGFLVRV